MSLKVNHNRQSSFNLEKDTEKLITDDLTKDQEPFLIQDQQQKQQKISNQFNNKELLAKPKILKVTEQIKQINETNQKSADTQNQNQENTINIQTKISNSPEANEFMPDVERFKQRLQANLTLQRYRDNVIQNEDTPEFHKIKQQVSLQRIRKPKPPTFSQTSSRFFQTCQHKEEKEDQIQDTNNNDEELQSDQNNTSINGTLQFLKKDQAIEALSETRWRSARNGISRELSIGLQSSQQQQQSTGISKIPLQVGSLREILLPQMVNESKSPMQSRLQFKISSNHFVSSQTTSNRIRQTSHQTPRKITNISQINMFAFNNEKDSVQNSNNNSNPGSEGLIRSERNIHFSSRSDRKINTNMSNSHLQLPSQFAQNYHKTKKEFQLTENLHSSTCLSKRAEPDLSQSNLKSNSQIIPQDQLRNSQSRTNKTEQQEQIKQFEYQPSIQIERPQELLVNNEQISPFDSGSPNTPLNDTQSQFLWKNPLSRQLQDLLHPLNSSSQPTLPQKPRCLARGQSIPRNPILTQGEISNTNKTQINENLNFSSVFNPQASYPASCKVIPGPVDQNNQKNVLFSTLYNSSSVLKHPSAIKANPHSIMISQKLSNSLSPSVANNYDSLKILNTQPNQQQEESQKKVSVQHSQHSQFRLMNRILKKKQSQNLTPARLSQDLSENGIIQQELLINQQTQTIKKENQKSVDRALPFTNNLIKEKIKQLLQGGAFKRPLPAYQPSKETNSLSGWVQEQQQQLQPQPQLNQFKVNQSRMTPQPTKKQQQLFFHSKSFKQISDERQHEIQTTSQKQQILSVIHAHDNLDKINYTIGDFEDTLSPVDWKQRGFSQGRIGEKSSKTPMHQNFSKSRRLLKEFSGKIGFDTP